MKTITIYLLPFLFLFVGGNVLAQDEFYNEKSKKKTTEKIEVESISKNISIEDYYTEKDYALKFKGKKEHIIKNRKEAEGFEKEANHTCENKNCCTKDFLGELAVEVAVEIFVNAAVILLSFWQ
jgi:predicted peptidase